MRELSGWQVDCCVQGKLGVELDLAKKLWGLFNSDPLLFYLRRITKPLIESIAVLARVDQNNRQVRAGAAARAPKWIKVFADARAKMRVWMRWGHGATFFDQIDNIVRHANSWDAADVADLALLFAEVVDAPGPAFRLTPDETRQAKDANRPGGKYWNKGGLVGRHRYNPAALPAGLPAAMVPQPAPQVTAHTDLARQLWLRPGGAYRTPGVTPGAEVWTLLPTSTVWKIDQLFGLPTAADISGTTADTVYVFEHLHRFYAEALGFGGGGPDDLAAAQEGFAALGDLIMLLPMATMVSQAHHSLLEIALTLNLNHYAHYSIGQYTSLMPPGAPSNEVRDRVLNVLSRAETDQRNHRLLCFMDGAGQRRAYLYGQDWLGMGVPATPVGGVALSPHEELARFQGLAQMTSERLDLMYALPWRLDRSWVDDIRGAVGL
ncbi:MAG: hypothetical protein P1P84_17295 [Deferrisomatales bacterium]|nr:hypothetical protein [Deferrisomatales bacterium]